MATGVFDNNGMSVLSNDGPWCLSLPYIRDSHIDVHIITKIILHKEFLLFLYLIY